MKQTRTREQRRHDLQPYYSRQALGSPTTFSVSFGELFSESCEIAKPQTPTDHIQQALDVAYPDPRSLVKRFYLGDL